MFPVTHTPTVTAGLKWAPEMWARIETITASTIPWASATPTRPLPVEGAMITEPAPMNTSANVPTNSATVTCPSFSSTVPPSARGERPSRPPPTHFPAGADATLSTMRGRESIAHIRLRVREGVHAPDRGRARPSPLRARRVPGGPERGTGGAPGPPGAPRRDPGRRDPVPRGRLLHGQGPPGLHPRLRGREDRKSTRLNSSHVKI